MVKSVLERTLVQRPESKPTKWRGVFAFLSTPKKEIKITKEEEVLLDIAHGTHVPHKMKTQLKSVR